MTLPTQLTEYARWITWRSEDGTKKPNCKWSDPVQWIGFHEVSDFDKIGFVFVEQDGLCGIDLDDCIDSEGNWNNESIGIMTQFEGVAYAEISPSGTGCKLITKAKKPKNAKCTNNAGVECYDKGRWFAITRKQVEGYSEITDGQKAVDWLCEKYLKQESKPAKAIVPIRFASKSLQERAEAYVDNADHPVEGGRNNAAFRLAGHLYSLVQPDGERLSESDVGSLVGRWNASLSSPLPESEIQSVVASANRSGTPRDDKEAVIRIEDNSDVNLGPLINKLWGTPEQEQADEDNDTDEDFCLAMVPDSGLIKQIFDYYCQSSYRQSNVMGLAVAMAICQTIFGRRVRSHTDIRTNDYNLILAATGSGKEACEATVTKILSAADPKGSHQLPPDVQSGNGLMHAISLNPCAVWVCDEFGKMLQAVLDKKGNHHLKQIGSHLLKLYGKSSGTYGGAAHSTGIRNQVNQPHLVVLGLSTGSTVFDCVTGENVSDGLLGRIAFWPVQDRPKPKEDLEIIEPSEILIQRVKEWIDFSPGGNLGTLNPKPETLRMSTDAKQRWLLHAKQIDERMRAESESRAGVWTRVAARSMKLSLCHRSARLEINPGLCQWDFVSIEIQDINWGIKLSNWLARIACGLIRENTVDKGLSKAKVILLKATESGPVSSRDLLRAYRGMTSGDFQAAADDLGYLTNTVRTEKAGRPKKTYERPMK